LENRPIFDQGVEGKILGPADPQKDFQDQGVEEKSFHGKGLWGQTIQIGKRGFRKVSFSLESSMILVP